MSIKKVDNTVFSQQREGGFESDCRGSCALGPDYYAH